MSYTFQEVQSAKAKLQQEFNQLSDKTAIVRSPVFKQLYVELPNKNSEQKPLFGAEVNALKKEVTSWFSTEAVQDNRQPIDVTAPFAPSTTKRPQTFTSSVGSEHPLMSEITYILDIFYRMGFTAMESRQIDDDYHMFESLNFPEGHPARDDYDTFMTTEGLIAPAHTSTMQNRALIQYKNNLMNGEPIAVVIPDRVFRNEDLDATHEHTFYQIEGVYVGTNVNVGNLIAVLQSYLSEFFNQELKAKIQPFYFPFTEPSFEFAVERPISLRKNNSEAEQWLELGGCGMIHPNVLKKAEIDPDQYTGFAFGFGIERMVMMKNDIEDVRHFESGKLDFLRQF
ncbi:MAG: phenylalanine--tRNA ligase subunit alpha [Candidatus Saccharimonadales bacterium]